MTQPTLVHGLMTKGIIELNSPLAGYALYRARRCRCAVMLLR